MAELIEVRQLERQLSLGEFESMLDKGLLYVKMNNGNWWKIRRNGKTKRWKRDPSRWEVPVKAGLRECMRVNDNTSMGFFGIGSPE